MKYLILVTAFFYSNIITGCTTNNMRIDNVPMYGEPKIKRSVVLQNADEDFIKKVVSHYGSRKKASIIWWKQGEAFIAEGNFDYAMRRYNQSWLLNSNNYQPYWGFARITLEHGKVDEAIVYLEKSKKLIDDPYQEVALLTDLASAYSIKGKTSPEYFKKANVTYAKSIKLDAKYADSWRRWAFSLYEQGRYTESQSKVKKAIALNAKPFPKSFIENLKNKLSK
jgi:tetratricopeptide (TPR) repeat protein